jgi:hypothetical protein
LIERQSYTNLSVPNKPVYIVQKHQTCKAHLSG